MKIKGKLLTRKGITTIAERLGWDVNFGSQTRCGSEKADRYVDFSQYSPAGEDFSFTVFYDRITDVPEKVFEYWQDFDIDERVEMWLEAKRNGVGGVPCARELVNDQEEIENMIEELWTALNCWSTEIEKEG